MLKTCPRCQSSIDVNPAETLRCPNCDTQDRPRVSEELATTDALVSVEPFTRERIGPYRILRRCGVGTFASVWKALDTRLNRIVALKKSHGQFETDEQRVQFRREAVATAALCHPAIVTVFDVITEDGESYIISQFIDGQSLAERIDDQENGLSLEAVLEIVASIAEAVHHAHERGIIHRDLKPANILLDQSGRPFVSDFGLARIQAADSAAAEGGRILGTPAYMSPEQATGKHDLVGPQSDVYSLGVILYELLTGHRPFAARNPDDLLRQIVSDDPPPPTNFNAGLHPVLDEICTTAIARRCSDRYASAAELASSLRDALDVISAERTPGDIAKPSSSRTTRSIVHGAEGVPARTRISRRGMMGALLALGGVGIGAGLTGGRPGMRDNSGRSSNGIHPGASHPESSGHAMVLQPGERLVKIATTVPGASVAIVPVDEVMNVRLDQIVQPAGVTPMTVPLAAGKYRIEAWHAGNDAIAEVERIVPESPGTTAAAGTLSDGWRMNSKGVLEMPTIILRTTADLELLTNSDLTMVAGGQLLSRLMPPAVRDKFAIPVDDFLVMPLKVRRPTIGHIPLPHNTQNNLSAWKLPALPLVDVDLPTVRQIAEKLGMRLIDEEEYEYLATNGGMTSFPWGNDLPAESVTSRVPESGLVNWYQAVTEPDVCQNYPDVRELYSGVPEWVQPSGISPIRVAELRNGRPQLPLSRLGQTIERAAVASQAGIARGIKWPSADEISNEVDSVTGAACRHKVPLESATDLPIGFRFSRSIRPRFVKA